ncbi:MAG: hypothetical protein ACO1SX_19110 [Actinomycetota bacterium]
MAAGPLFPQSAYPVTASRVFPNVHVGSGANSKHDEGLGVEASLGADAIWRLRFQLPPTLPSGTGKLRLLCLANAISGVAKINPKWASVAVGESPSGATLNAEGVTADTTAGGAGATATLEWGAGDNDQYIQAKWVLNADTLVGGEIVVMDLTFETSGWTLAAVLTCIPTIIWE